jgi:hypothetical protein
MEYISMAVRKDMLMDERIRDFRGWPIQPERIDVSVEAFLASSASRLYPLKTAAWWLVRFCQWRASGWAPFTQAEIDRFYQADGQTDGSFACDELMERGYLGWHNRQFWFTPKFVLSCWLPRFTVQYTLRRGEQELGPFETTCVLPLGEQEFLTAYLDLESELFGKHGGSDFASVILITAAEFIPGGDWRPGNDPSGVAEGSVVWRDWSLVDTWTDAAARKAAIELAQAFRPLWRDRGTDWGVFVEMLCPEPWEVREYGLTAEMGFVIPVG